MNVTAEMKIGTRIVNAKTGAIVKETIPKKNLILDMGLNSWARLTTPGPGATTPASSFTACRVGDGTTPTSFASGAITFTQAATTITASGGFFTAAMVGAIFKWGTGSGGNEVYITGFTDSTHVTVDTSATVAVAEIATVWMVQQNQLDNQLHSTNTYQTSAGDCESAFTGNVVTHKRTFIVPQKGANYNVNEIGWSSSTADTATLCGRIVLSSTDVVTTDNFYVVVMTLTVTYSPATPTAVADVGTAIDTAGTAALEQLTGASAVIATVSTTGSTNAGGVLDGGASNSRYQCFPVDYTQNGAPTTTKLVATTPIVIGTGNTWVKDSARGKMTLTYNNSITTTGQTIYGFGLCWFDGSTTNILFDVYLDTPFTAPTGNFQPIAVWSCTYNRTLTN
jgi:hypothetical protein